MKVGFLLIVSLAITCTLVIGQNVSNKSSSSKNDLLSEQDVSLDDQKILEKYGSFFGSFISTTLSEIGDKTFIMTAILSSKYNRMWVFIGNLAAVLLMSFISCFLGSISEYILPMKYIKFLSSGLFFFFGCKLLYEVITDTVDDEDDEAEEEIELMEKRLAKIVKKSDDKDDDISKASAVGDKQKHQISTQSTLTHEEQKKKKKQKNQIGINAPGYLIAMQTFVSNFFGEWGDRSQISTIAISATFDFWKVFFGTTLGQIFCTMIALLGGQMMAKQFSEKTMALIGGILFLLYGGITLMTALNSLNSNE